jgi:periplasmic divalent cation tolerance protein
MTPNNKGPDPKAITKPLELVEAGGVADCVAALVYTTFPNREAALAVARSLVESRVAGCVNIIPAMTSVYVWDGKTEVADEVVLIAKAPAAAVKALVQALEAAHPYDVPAILVIAVTAANGAYLAWLNAGVDPLRAD